MVRILEDMVVPLLEGTPRLAGWKAASRFVRQAKREETEVPVEGPVTWVFGISCGRSTSWSADPVEGPQELSPRRTRGTGRRRAVLVKGQVPQLQRRSPATVRIRTDNCTGPAVGGEMSLPCLSLQTPSGIPMPLTSLVCRSLLAPLLLATPLLTSCTGPDEPVVATPSNATVTVDVLGGFTPYRWSTSVASDTERWTKIRCDATLSATPCPRGTVLASGSIQPDALTSLVQAASSDAARALPNNIPGGAGPEVDGVLYTLTVDDGTGRRSVLWRSGATLPAALELIVTRLDVAISPAWRSP